MLFSCSGWDNRSLLSLVHFADATLDEAWALVTRKIQGRWRPAAVRASPLEGTMRFGEKFQSGGNSSFLIITRAQVARF